MAPDLATAPIRPVDAALRSVSRTDLQESSVSRELEFAVLTLSPGARLGPYEVVSPIGAGGMGEVYRARDARLNRDVAIKVLPASFSNDPDRLRRFEQEAKAAGALNHPNIVAVYDVGSHDGAPYVVSELLEGETLREVLAGGGLPPRRAADYALQMAQGLAAAHDKGIVHRDLKPENLFVTKDRRLKILDFGLAKLVAPESVSGPVTEAPTATAGTEPGVVMGTLDYMAPEQARGTSADARSDIFAFGAILYEMLSGQRAFRRDSAADTISAILKEDLPGFGAVRRDIPPELDRIVRHRLEKKPEHRFQSAHDLAFAFSASASEADRGETGSPRRIWALFGAALTGLAAAIGLFLWHARSGQAVRPGSPDRKSIAVLPFQNLSPIGERLLRRRDDRGHPDAARQGPRLEGDLPNIGDAVQGDAEAGAGDRFGVGRGDGPRGECAPSRRPGPHRWPARGRTDRRAPLGRDLRPRVERRLRDPERGRAADCRRPPGDPLAGREEADRTAPDNLAASQICI